MIVCVLNVSVLVLALDDDDWVFNWWLFFNSKSHLIESSLVGVRPWCAIFGRLESSSPTTVAVELFPSNSSFFKDGTIEGIDEDVVVTEESSSVLNRNEPVELTPLELCTLRKELVINDESPLSLDCSLFHDIRLRIVIDDDEICFVGVGAVFVSCVLVPSAVKYRPKFFRSVREFLRVCSTILKTSDSTFDERRGVSTLEGLGLEGWVKGRSIEGDEGADTQS
jgi:hypothetical protein